MQIKKKVITTIFGVIGLSSGFIQAPAYAGKSQYKHSTDMITQNGNKFPQADPNVLMSNRYIQDLKLDFYLFMVGALNRTEGSDTWTHYTDIPDTKFYVDFKLFNALTFHSLTKYITTPTPVAHTIDFTEDYFTTKPLNHHYWVVFGKKWLDFSSFKSTLYISPVTKKLGHINQYTLSVSANIDNTTLTGYIFRPKNKLNDHGYVGYGLDLKHSWGKLIFGASFINSLSDQIVLQYNSGTGGFIDQVSLYKKVPAASIYSTFNYKDWYVYDAIISAISRFDTRDLEFNQKGARPLAASIEVGKHFKLFKQNLTAVARAEYTKAMLYAKIPKYQLTLGLNDQVSNHLLLQVQGTYAKSYAKADQAYQQSKNKTVTGTGKGNLGIMGIITLRF